jgi:hypothetical protein
MYCSDSVLFRAGQLYGTMGRVLIDTERRARDFRPRGGSSRSPI